MGHKKIYSKNTSQCLAISGHSLYVNYYYDILVNSDQERIMEGEMKNSLSIHRKQTQGVFIAPASYMGDGVKKIVALIV